MQQPLWSEKQNVRVFAILASAALLVAACSGDFLETERDVQVWLPCSSTAELSEQLEEREALYSDVPVRAQFVFSGAVCDAAAAVHSDTHIWLGDADFVAPQGSEPVATECGFTVYVSEDLAGTYPVEDDSEMHATVSSLLFQVACED